MVELTQTCLSEIIVTVYYCISFFGVFSYCHAFINIGGLIFIFLFSCQVGYSEDFPPIQNTSIVAKFLLHHFSSIVSLVLPI